MRVVVDALGVDRGGGLLTVVRNVVGAWPEVAPDDDVVLVVSTRARDLVPRPAPGREVVAVDLGPHRQVGRLSKGAWTVRDQARSADVVLATLPLVPTFGSGGTPCVAMVYDLRHRLRPTDFSHVEVLQRTVLYHHAIRRADAVVASSQRTADDIEALFAHHAPLRVVHLGADHVPAASSPGRAAHGLVQGHFANKGVDLALETWACLQADHGVTLPLLVTGVAADERSRWAARAEALGLGDRVTIAPWLSDEDFGTALDDAAVLLFPSRCEGFGLPVLEAMRRRVPVAIAPDPALLEVTAGHASVATAWSADSLAEAVQRALGTSDGDAEAAFAHAGTFTWARCVEQVRQVCERAIQPGHGFDG